MVANNYDNSYYTTLQEPLKVKLLNDELWKKFHRLETEMIITKSGRRMFPPLRVETTGMDPSAHYCIFLEFSVPVNCHYKYKYASAMGWTPVGSEEAQSPNRVYLHPDSPATGKHWMSQPIAFGRVKLTNTTSPPPGQVVLSSMHKYQPTIIVARSSDPMTASWAPNKTIIFPETQFVGVTAYQNDEVTKLKINHNPFAKGFRDNGQSKNKRKERDHDEEQAAQKSENCSKIDTERIKVEETHRESRVCIDISEESVDIKEERASTPQAHSIRCFPNYYPISSLPYYDTLPYYVSSNNFAYANFWNIYYSRYPYHYPVQLSPPMCNNSLRVLKPKKLTDFSIRAITGIE